MTNYHDRAVPPVALHRDIACRPKDNAVFFPEDYAAGRRQATRLARQLCHDCPHEQECLLWALATRQRYGVWGGTTAYERERLWARRKNSQPLQRPRTV
jgi:WhiB family redox-sensing transcriptional regulator